MRRRRACSRRTRSALVTVATWRLTREGCTGWPFELEGGRPVTRSLADGRGPVTGACRRSAVRPVPGPRCGRPYGRHGRPSVSRRAAGRPSHAAGRARAGLRRARGRVARGCSCTLHRIRWQSAVAPLGRADGLASAACAAERRPAGRSDEHECEPGPRRPRREGERWAAARGRSQERGPRRCEPRLAAGHGCPPLRRRRRGCRPESRQRTTRSRAPAPHRPGDRRQRRAPATEERRRVDVAAPRAGSADTDVQAGVARMVCEPAEPLTAGDHRAATHRHRAQRQGAHEPRPAVHGDHTALAGDAARRRSRGRGRARGRASRRRR